MKLKVYIANAFSKKNLVAIRQRLFHWRTGCDEELMQQIAAQNNLAETAYIVPKEKDYAIRWFTPSWK